MSGDQAKSTGTGADQNTNPPALPQYPPQPFPGAPYPPPGAYTWYYPPPADPNGDPNGPPPGPYVMLPPPGIMYGYPPPPAPTQGVSCISSSVFRLVQCKCPSQGYAPFTTPTPAVVTRMKRQQVKMAVCPTCCALLIYLTDWHIFVTSARIVPPPASGAMRHVRAKDVKSMDSQKHAWTACVSPERSGSSVVPTNVKANFRLPRRLRTQVSSSRLPVLYATTHIYL